MACRVGGGRLRGVGGWRWAGRKRRGSLVETWRRRKGHDEWDIQIRKREKRDARDETARCKVATATYLQGLTDAAVIRQTSRLREAPEGSALARGERFARLADDHYKKAGGYETRVSKDYAGLELMKNGKRDDMGLFFLSLNALARPLADGSVT